MKLQQIDMKISKTIQPAVSIALCTYNGDRFLKEQLDSILNQEYNNIAEVICVDDNSTDHTWEILENYAKKYAVFKIFKNKSNLGFIKNYEKAVTLTTSQFIAISDQDDIWYPSKISKLIAGIGNNLMIYSDNDFIDINGESCGIKFSDKRNLTTCTSCLNFALFNVISGHTMLFNRDLLKYALPFPIDIPYDFWLGFQAVQQGKIQVVNEALVGYRQHENNIIGGYGVKINNKKDFKFKPINETSIRVQIFSENILPHLVNEKLILKKLGDSYADRSLKMRVKRIRIFWENKDALLLFKKRNKMRKMIYCVKAFWKYD